MYDSKLSSESRSRSPEKQVLGWLRKRISPYGWGWSKPDKTGFRQVTRRQILGFFDARRFGLRGGWLPRLTNQRLMEHFCGSQFLYFQADGRIRTPEVLVLIDIDCHDRGTYEGAVACVEWLAHNGFPGLFWSRSTNGRGVHAYLVVDKRECGSVGLDGALQCLERWLKYQHRQ